MDKEIDKKFEYWLLNDYWTKNGFMGSPPIKELRILYNKTLQKCKCCGR